nr:NifU family protein [Elusimicrobiota bacterium]
MVKITHIEATPNPHALKFIVDGRLLETGAKSYASPAAVGDDALARALFSVGKEVRSVFYMDRFVTVTKSPEADWKDLQSRVVEAVETAAQPLAPGDPSEKTEFPADGGTALSTINQVLDAHIRPYLANDGGGLEVIDYRDYVLTVRYQGA